MCSWGWEHAQHLEERNWGVTARNVSVWGETRPQTLLQISALQSCGACWTRVLFQPWKMTGILCANWVQMWGWVSHITHILSCLHVRFHLQTISNFQIALYFFFGCRSSSNCGQIPLAPWLVGGDPIWERRSLLALLCPRRREGGRIEFGSKGWSRVHPGAWAHAIPSWWVSFPVSWGIPTCEHGVGQRASRTMAMRPRQPCPDLNSALWHVHHVLSCALRDCL